MDKTPNNKQYDLEERTYIFAKECRSLVKKLPKIIVNFEDGRQLVRSSGSVAANYIEANEALSKKEAKESRLWLKLIDTQNDSDLEKKREKLMKEATELMRIFGSIIEKSK